MVRFFFFLTYTYVVISAECFKNYKNKWFLGKKNHVEVIKIKTKSQISFYFYSCAVY